MVRLHCFVSLLGMALFLTAGCSSGPSDAPPRYRLSGQVLFADEPVPTGTIRILPDADAGNRGPGAYARIENGTFQIDSPKGIIGGPVVVTIEGFDGIPVEISGETVEVGKPLFPPYQTNVTLPKEDSVYDFHVPSP